MEKLKVLFVDHERVLGGAELSMVALVENLSKQGVTCHAAIASDGPLSERLKNAGARSVFYMPMDSWRWWETGFANRMKLILSLPIQIYNVFKWVQLYKRVKPDIIHFNLSRLVEPVIASKFFHAKAIMHFRELSSTNSRFWGGLSWFYKIMRAAPFWIANSAYTHADISRYGRETTIETISNGIDTTQFLYALAPVLELPDGKFIVSMVAGLVGWKNHKDYIDIALLVTEQRKDVLFLIVGEGKKVYEDELKQYAKTKGVEEFILFTGRINDIPALLHQTDIVVHTSKEESFGRVYVEGMLASKPVVAYNGGAAAEVILNGHTGFVVDGDAALLADKILLLLEDEVKRKQFGVAGRERAIAHYSIEKCTNNLIAFYEKVLNRKSYNKKHA